jgi:hypothetical protein
MHGNVERRAGLSQSEVALYNKTTGLRLVIRLARGAPWSVYILRIFVCRSFTDLVT